MSLPYTHTQSVYTHAYRGLYDLLFLVREWVCSSLALLRKNLGIGLCWRELGTPLLPPRNNNGLPASLQSALGSEPRVVCRRSWSSS